MLNSVGNISNLMIVGPFNVGPAFFSIVFVLTERPQEAAGEEMPAVEEQAETPIKKAG